MSLQSSLFSYLVQIDSLPDSPMLSDDELLTLTLTLLIKLFMHWTCTFIKPRALGCNSMLCNQWIQSMNFVDTWMVVHKPALPIA